SGIERPGRAPGCQPRYGSPRRCRGGAPRPGGAGSAGSRGPDARERAPVIVTGREWNVEGASSPLPPAQPIEEFWMARLSLVLLAALFAAHPAAAAQQ